MKIIKIDKEKQAYNTKWRANALLDGELIIVSKGHSKDADYNFEFFYEDEIWGSDDQVNKFIALNFVEPELIKMGVAYDAGNRVVLAK